MQIFFIIILLQCLQVIQKMVIFSKNTEHQISKFIMISAALQKLKKNSSKMNSRITIRILLILGSFITSSSIVFSQSVMLTWLPSQDENVSHYNIFRSIHDTLHFQHIGITDYDYTAFTDKNIHLETRYFYTATTILNDGTESVFSDFAEVYIGVQENNELGFELNQNYPNPFNPSTDIYFSLSNPQFVTAKVFDIRGMEISTLYKGYKKAGSHKLVFDGKNIKSGVFFININAGGIVKTRKMMLLK